MRRDEIAPISLLPAFAWSGRAMSDNVSEGKLSLPVGTVTFLLTDIESSTRLWQDAPDDMAEAVTRHYEILHDAVSNHGGVRPEEQGEGDSIVAAFARASDAVSAALAAQIALENEPWPTPRSVRVRMAVHTGEARLRDEANYVGMAIIRTARLRALAHGGQIVVSSASRDLALDQLGDAVELRDIGEHRLKDLARHERVYQVVHPELAPVFPPLRSLDATPNNLPVRLSTFVGRHAELATVEGLLRDHRLVTVSGAGGAGKTRLALQSSANAVERFLHGVWWVELAPLSDAETVPNAVASVVGAQLNESRDPAQVIAARLDTDCALVILDNCEHVLDACSKLADTILRLCPNVCILATSRSPLGVPGEVVWRIPPLSAPETGVDTELGDLIRFDAIWLFSDRARDARPTFTISAANASSVAEICNRLDGIPLAIELAAARAKSLTPAQILGGLSDALQLLTGGSRRVLPRQQTLDASIRWSCALLSDIERSLLFRLSVFSGSFDLVAAECVCSGTGLEEVAVLDALDRLIDGSLVVALEREREGRFLILETVRQFGNRQLVVADELELWRQRHAFYYARLSCETGPLCETQHQFSAVAALDVERDNVRTALSWLRENGRGEELAATILALDGFWDVAGPRLDAADWCGRALDLLGEEPTAVRARLIAMRAESRLPIGEFSLGVVDAQAGIAMGKLVGDPKAEGRASAALTSILSVVSLDAWRPQWELTERLLGEANDAFPYARLLTWRGVPMIRRGLTRQGIEALELAAVHVERTGQPMLIASQRFWEGFAALQSGDLERAERLARSALDSGALGLSVRIAIAELVLCLSRYYRLLDRPSAHDHLAAVARAKREHDPVVADVHFYLALLELLDGDPAECLRVSDAWNIEHPKRPATAQCTEAIIGTHAAFRTGRFDDAELRAKEVIRLSQLDHNVVEHARAHIVLAAVALTRHEVAAADKFVRVAIASHVENGNMLWIPDAFETLAAVAAACGDHVEVATLLGSSSSLRAAQQAPGRVYEALAAGARDATRTAMGDTEFDRAFALGATLSIDEVLAYIDRTHGSRRRPALGWSSLTPTEHQVAELVRTGLSNREIASRLIMGTETAKTHVSHIFTKLGLTKRAQLAALATAHSIQSDETKE